MDSPEYAKRMVDRLTRRSQQIANFPLSGRRVPEYDTEAESGRKAVNEPALPMETGGQVLLVEKEELVRKMFRSILNRFGFDVLIAKDGVETLDIFRNRPDEIRLVITDLTMPHMNGWETLAGLRKIRPDIPVILASGYDDAHVMAADYVEKPQAFLHKPFEIKTMQETLERVIGLDKLH